MLSQNEAIVQPQKLNIAKEIADKLNEDKKKKEINTYTEKEKLHIYPEQVEKEIQKDS